MRTICQECKETITPGPEEIPSHGLCESCMPDFMRRGGVSEKDIAIFTKEINEEKEKGK